MKKKWMIGIGAVVVIGVAAFFAMNLLGGAKESPKAEKSADEEYGIEYFEVPDVDQVYINGVVQPDQTEAFTKDAKITSEPELKVKNGDIVEAGTELYTYEDKEVTKEIEAQNNTINKLYTKRENVVAKWNQAIANFNNTKEEERTTTKAVIDEQYQSEVDAVDEEIYFTNATISDLTEQQFISVASKFKGRVSIPEVKDENSPILRLTSEGLYVAGKVNEKDLPKIALDQKADITVVSNGNTVTGRISYIDDNPPESQNNQAQDGVSSNASMSSYTVKLSMDSTEGIKNGYHVQGTINMDDGKTIEIPTKAIHEENEEKYVLVNDFGSVIRRVVHTGAENGENTVINSGLESADRIIVSSKKEVKEGDLLEGAPSADETETQDAA